MESGIIWTGWTFSDNYLIDPDGNRYSPVMIKSSLFTLELSHELTGSPLQIISLKQKLIKMTSPKKITIELTINGENFCYFKELPEESEKK